MSFREVGLLVVYAVYGGAWLVTGIALWLYGERTARLGVAAHLRLLSLFAIVHGLSDVVDIGLRLPGVTPTPTSALGAIRLALLAASFILLLQFGLAITIRDPRIYRSVITLGLFGLIGLAAGLLALYAEGPSALEIGAVERAIRLLIGLPGALLGGYGFYMLSRRCRALNMRECARDTLTAAVCLATYGVLAGAITSGYPTPTVILGLPIQFYRMLAAIGLTVACISLLKRLQVRPAESEGSV